MYERRSRLNSHQQTELIKFFVAGATARAAGKIAGVNRNTAASYFMRLRRLIAMHLPGIACQGKLRPRKAIWRSEKRQTWPGGYRENSGFRVTEAQWEGLYGHNTHCANRNAHAHIEARVEPDSIVSTDMFPAYNALDVRDFHRHRIDHSRLFAKQGNHINGIENFWNQARRHSRKFNGILPEHSYWFLKEGEWRFNGDNPKERLTQLNSWAKEAKH